MTDATTRAIAESLRRWWRHEKVVPIERGYDYRLQREARECARQIPNPQPRPTPPAGPAAA